MKWLARIAVFLVVVIFSLLIYLCFFQFPSMDDYVTKYIYNYYHGNWGDTIAGYLTYGNGRYASIPLFVSVTISPFLMDHYALVLVFFIALTIVSVYVFLRTVNRQLFSIQLSRWQALALSGLMLTVLLATMPDVATFLFWVATSTTYLISLCVFLFLISAYLLVLRSNEKNKWGRMALACLLTVIGAGCNEVILYYSFALPVLIVMVSRKAPRPVWLLIGFNVLLLVLIMQIPGLRNRSQEFTQKQSLLFSVLGSVYRGARGMAYIFSSPLFYISCFGVGLLSAYFKPSFAKRTHWLVEAVLLLGMVLAFHVVVRQMGGETLPARAINIMNCITVIGFWFIILINCRGLLPGHSALLTRSFWGLFIIALVSSPFMISLFKNVVAAPVHARIVGERELRIAEAKKQNRHSVVIEPYEVEAGKVLDKWFPAKKRFILEKNFLPPSLFFFRDEPNVDERAYFYAEYHGIDTIITTQGPFLRWKLTGNLNPWR